MAVNEIPVLSSLLMDRDTPLGNSDDADGRRALHTKIKNKPTEPIYVSGGTATANPFAPPPGTDYIGRSVASNVEVFVYRNGGSLGTLLSTVTVTYSDNTLDELVSVTVA
jgi:hypothetical protein